jgi:hypothetical protein
MITERTTCSHDFIYTVTTLFTQLRLYLLGTPGAQDSRVQDHRRLNHPVAELCGKSLLPGIVDRHESMAQGEVKLLDESHNEGRQQRRSDPAESFPVSERVHKAGCDGAHQSHIVTPAK